MTFDYDLSDFSVDQANLWIYLHADSVRTDILAGRGSRTGVHSIEAARVVSHYCAAVKGATGIAGARSYPLMRDN